MSAPNASSSSSQLIAYAQDVDYTRTEGFKRFKSRYNVKNTRAARNNPNGAYPSAETVYQAMKGPGCSLRSFDSLSLNDFISSGSVAAHCRLKCLSLAPYYMAQMKRCTQKWDRRDNQGQNSLMIDTCRQLVSIVGTGLYHSMADVQSRVGRTVDLLLASADLTFLLVRQRDALRKQCGDHAYTGGKGAWKPMKTS